MWSLIWNVACEKALARKTCVPAFFLADLAAHAWFFFFFFFFRLFS
jgi:hypothetical protein